MMMNNLINLELLTKVLQKDIRFVSVAAAKLLESKVRPILDIPLWSNGSPLVFSTDRLRTDFRTEFKGHYQSLVETCEWKRLKTGRKESRNGKRAGWDWEEKKKQVFY